MTDEVVVERDETLAPVPESEWLRAHVESLRRGNAELLKENHRLREELAAAEARTI